MANLTDRELRKLADYISERLIAQNRADSDEILGTDDAARLLNIKPATLRRKCCKGEVPHTKRGRRLLFSKNALMGFVLN